MRHGMSPGGERGPDSVAWEYRQGLAVGEQSNFSVVSTGTEGTTRMRLLRSGQGGALVSSISSDTLAGPGRKVLAYYESLQRGRKGSGGIYGVAINDVNTSRIRTIRLTGRKKLNYFTLWGQSEVKSVDLSGSPDLTSVSVYGNPFMSQLNVARCKNLQQLYITNCANLRTLSISEASRSKISNLLISSCPVLENRIDLSKMTLLSQFQVSNVYLGETADFRNTLVTYFDGQMAQFKHYFTATDFYSFSVNGNQYVKTVDASSSGYMTYIDAAGSTLESLTLPQDWSGANGKASVYVNGTQMSSAALVSMLNQLGDATQNYKNYVDIRDCPGTGTPQVDSAAADAVFRGWNVTGISP